MEDVTPWVHTGVMRFIEAHRQELGVEPAALRVLDYGCGRGDSVLFLRQAGYQAFGADIWTEGIVRARVALSQAGFPSDMHFSVVDEHGRTAFEDGQFDIIVSQQVFEHVVDLELVGRELQRISAPGGVGFHVFPPRRQPREGHFGMPFTHWLPKNRLRHAAILVYAVLGVGGRPPEIPGAGPVQRARFLYEYSVTQTFYRPHADVARSLRTAGLDTCFAITNHRRLRANPVLRWLGDQAMLRPLLEWPLLTFGGMQVLTRRDDDGTQPATILLDSWQGRWQRRYGTSPSQVRPADNEHHEMPVDQVA